MLWGEGSAFILFLYCELTARSCGPLLHFFIQIDGQHKSWRSHIFSEEKEPYTAPYFHYSLSPFIGFLIDFYSIFNQSSLLLAEGRNVSPLFEEQKDFLLPGPLKRQDVNSCLPAFISIGLAFLRWQLNGVARSVGRGAFRFHQTLVSVEEAA